MKMMKMKRKDQKRIIWFATIVLIIISLAAFAVLVRQPASILGFESSYEEHYSVQFTTTPDPDSVDEIVVIQANPPVRSQTIYTSASSVVLSVEINFDDLVNRKHGIWYKYKNAITNYNWLPLDTIQADIDTSHNYIGTTGIITISKTAISNAPIWTFMLQISSRGLVDGVDTGADVTNERLDIIIEFVAEPVIEEEEEETTTTKEPEVITTVVNGTTVVITETEPNGASGFSVLIVITVITPLIIWRKRKNAKTN